MNKSSIIAFIGKGGVGKTVLSALAGRIFIEQGKKVLFIDADPAMGLATSLRVEGYKTIGKAREEIIKQARISNSTGEKEKLSDIIDYLLLEALFERSDFSMIVMGQTNTLGCYCPVNNLLRSTISFLASNYEVIIIDAEAGIEQVNRQVVETVQYPIIVTDNSVKGVKTALMIAGRIKDIPTMTPVKTGVIFNRVAGVDPSHENTVTSSGLLSYGCITSDQLILDYDQRGVSLIELPSNSSALLELKVILTTQGLI